MLHLRKTITFQNINCFKIYLAIIKILLKNSIVSCSLVAICVLCIIKWEKYVALYL